MYHFVRLSLIPSVSMVYSTMAKVYFADKHENESWSYRKVEIFVDYLSSCVGPAPETHSISSNEDRRSSMVTYWVLHTLLASMDIAFHANDQHLLIFITGLKLSNHQSPPVQCNKATLQHESPPSCQATPSHSLQRIICWADINPTLSWTAD